MADPSEPPALFEDEALSKPESEDQTNPEFGETTEISLDADEPKKDEAASVTDEPKTEQKEEGRASPEPEPSAAADTANVTKPEESAKPEAAPRKKVEVCTAYFKLFEDRKCVCCCFL